MVSLLAFFPVVEALLSLAISSVLFKKWWSTGDRSTKFWAWAFLFHFFAYVIRGIFVSRLFIFQAVQYFLLQFMHQTLESLLFLSVYFGIITILTTKRSLTFTIPFVFFMLQELILLYFDFFVKDLRLAEQLHIVFFDVPFNILVALLFWKFYLVGKKKYAALISGGWFLYAVFVPIFFYTEGNILLYTLSLSHMIIMFAGFVLLYESPTGQAILEITPAVEKRLSTVMKYSLKPGKTYLIENIDKAYNIFMDAVLHGIRGMIMTRTKPEMIQQKYELRVTPVLWLTHVQTALPTADPSELEQLGFLMEKFMASAKEQALTEGEALPEKPLIIEHKPQTMALSQPSSPPPQQQPPVAEKKPEEPWKQKMKETIAEVAGRKPIVLGEEGAEKPLKEVVKEVEKAGVVVAVKRGKILVFGEEKKDEKKEVPAAQQEYSPTITLSQPKIPQEPFQSSKPVPPSRPLESPPVPDSQPLPPFHSSRVTDHHPQTSSPSSSAPSVIVPSLAEKPLKELVAEVQKTGAALEIKGKPSETAQVEIKKEESKPGKFLIIGEEKKDAKTKASFILAAGDISVGSGLNKSIILIDGLEYLITNNTFALVLHLLQMLKDKISLGESMLLLPIDPKCINEKEIALLRQEFETYVGEKD